MQLPRLSQFHFSPAVLVSELKPPTGITRISNCSRRPTKQPIRRLLRNVPEQIPAQILNTATYIATENGYQPGTLAVHYPPIAGAYAGDTKAIEVELSIQLQRYFTSFFFDDMVTERVRAVAIMQTAANACVLALSTTMSHAARFSGSSSLNLVGCTIMSNSMTSDAVQVQGSATLSTDCIIAVGDVDLTSGATMTECPGAITNAPPAADPFADVPIPTSANNLYRHGRRGSAAGALHQWHEPQRHQDIKPRVSMSSPAEISRSMRTRTSPVRA